MAQHLLFTHELLLASGCEDNPRTLKMVDILNGISVLWGREIMFYLEKIVNTVKSKTDELRSVLDFSALDNPQTAQQCTPDQKIKRLEDEVQKHIQNLKKLGDELQTQKDANKDLRKAVVIQERNFRAFLKSYNANWTARKMRPVLGTGQPER